MLRLPIVRPHFRMEIVAREGVFLLSEHAQVSLRGRLHELVVPYLDGQYSTSQIVERLEGQASAAEVYYTLDQLEKKGYISERDSALPVGEAAWWSLQD